MSLNLRCSILQGIFIMKKLGLPDDNMLLIDAGEVKALILEEKALDIMNENFGNDVNDRGLYDKLLIVWTLI